MTGAEAGLRTALAAGVEVCFANPGTSELALVAALDAAPVGYPRKRVRSILGLFEGVCTGAADGYGRMTGRPALVLLHLGPGLGNGIANLHNARKGRSPVIALIGDHPPAHGALNPPLHSDIAALAAPVSGWVRVTRSVEELGRDVAEAIAAATGPPGTVATLVLPSDCQWAPGGLPAAPLPPGALPPLPEPAVQSATAALQGRGCGGAALLLGGPALRERGLRAAARIAARTGCRLLCESVPARVERGGGLPALERVPYLPEHAIALLAPLACVVLAGATEPRPFFHYEPTQNRLLPPEAVVHPLASAREDAAGALEILADALGCPDHAPATAAGSPIKPPGSCPPGPLTPESLCAAVASLLPEDAIVIDEGITSGRPFWELSGKGPRHTYLSIAGGSIGWGPPCATGVAVACPERPVIALQADGSALYTFQALWTQAREGLNVTTVLCANRVYRILQIELQRAGVEPGPAAQALTDLGRPAIDWVRLAESLGVPAVRADAATGLAQALARAIAEPGPFLIEAAMV
jgi:acetolactate synthase-1/2/3 large subunit